MTPAPAQNSAAPNGSAALDLDAPLLVGFGVTSRAVAKALVSRGHRPIVVEERPSDVHRTAAAQLGLELVEAPDADRLSAAVAQASVLLPSPGVPDHHPVFGLAAGQGLAIASEFDLAQRWDSRPVVAITGTNGKTTVTMMVADALDQSGRPADPVGNTDVPFIESVENADTEVFVVEASSFRLAHSADFHPDVAAWLNFAPDHLDAHRSLQDYEDAKASIWANLRPGAMIIANADDPVVAARCAAIDRGDVTVQTFSISGAADWWIDRSGPEPVLCGPDGPFIEVGALSRRQPHDLANALATAAISLASGATLDGIATTLRSFAGLAHRLEFLGTWDGIGWYNDSKATVPHATVAAVGGFGSVVLIAGGRAKGLSFDPLKATVPPVRAVVSIGDAAEEVEAIYAGLAPFERAGSMGEAIKTARSIATSGDVVLLSPACASFDWYPNYVERGLDFTRLVHSLIGAGGQQDDEGPTPETSPQ